MVFFSGMRDLVRVSPSFSESKEDAGAATTGRVMARRLPLENRMRIKDEIDGPVGDRTRSCAVCGQVNETGRKHCTYCGAVLVPGEDPGTDPGTPESPLAE